MGSPGRAGRCVEGACWSTDIFYVRLVKFWRECGVQVLRHTTIFAPV